ncbi:hypothetical protein V6N13_107706 [Hibiscus sabdariffa]
MPMRSLNGFAMADHSAVSQGGRPPDESMIVVDGDALERPGSPVPEGPQPVQKKVRSFDAPGTEGVMIIDEDLSGNLRRDASSTQPVADGNGGTQQPVMPSFRDKLLEGSGKLVSASVVTDLEVEDDCGGNGAVESAAATIETPRDPSELYGPWMQVSHRRRRSGMHKTIPIGGAGSKSAKPASGSRFMVLEEEQEGVVDMGGDQEATGNNSRMEGLRGSDGRVEEVEDAPPRMVLEKPGQLSSGQGVRLNEANVGSSKGVVVRTDGECRVMGTSQIAPSFAVAQGKDWVVFVRHVPRECNGVADSLAALGRDYGWQGSTFPAPPRGIVHRLDDERQQWLSTRPVQRFVDDPG